MHTGQISLSFVCCSPCLYMLNPCLIGAWNLCTTRILRDVQLKFLISSRWYCQCEDSEYPWGCSFNQPLYFFLFKKIATCQLPKKEQKEIGPKTSEWKHNPFCGGHECDLIDTIHLQCSPPCALGKDICNWCQGPINHLVSKRPCNAFYISTYVESERVYHRCEPLS